MKVESVVRTSMEKSCGPNSICKPFPGDYRDLFRAIAHPLPQVIDDIRELLHPHNVATDPAWPITGDPVELLTIFERLSKPMRLAALLVAIDMKFQRWQQLAPKHILFRGEPNTELIDQINRPIGNSWSWLSGCELPEDWGFDFANMWADIESWTGRWLWTDDPDFADSPTSANFGQSQERRFLLAMMKAVFAIDRILREEKLWWRNSFNLPRFLALRIVDLLDPGEWSVWWKRVRARFPIADFNALEYGTFATTPDQDRENPSESEG